jgi:hypothetical protein
MASALHPPAIKLVGSNRQISLGRQYAGRHVLVKESETMSAGCTKPLPRQTCRLQWPGPPATLRWMPTWMKPCRASAVLNNHGNAHDAVFGRPHLSTCPLPPNSLMGRLERTLDQLVLLSHT